MKPGAFSSCGSQLNSAYTGAGPTTSSRKSSTAGSTTSPGATCFRSSCCKGLFFCRATRVKDCVACTEPSHEKQNFYLRRPFGDVSLLTCKLCRGRTRTLSFLPAARSVPAGFARCTCSQGYVSHKNAKWKERSTKVKAKNKQAPFDSPTRCCAGRGRHPSCDCRL